MNRIETGQTQDLSAGEKRILLASLLKQKARRAMVKHPMSFGQQALWFLYKNAPDSVAYNTAFAVRIRSVIDMPAWRSALQGLLNRHEVLRARFPMENGEPVQLIPGYCDIPFEAMDASGWNKDRLQREVADAYNQPFDLEKGPVIKTYLYSQETNNHVFLMVVHHIAFDAWSLWLCLEELRELYEASTQRRASMLSPVDVCYTDYVKQQNEWVTSPTGLDDLAFWKNELRDAAPPLNLITDKRRPVTPAYRGASLDFNLAPELFDDLKVLAQSEEVTLYVLLLAILQVLLHRYTGQDKVAVGTPTAGRNDGQFAKTVGYFVNPITVQGDLSGNPSFRSFLQQTRRKLLDGMAHHEYPFPLLVQKLNPKRDASRSTFFQVEFVLQRPSQTGIAELIAPGEGTRVRWAGLELESFDMGQQEGQFDLTLDAVEAKGSLFGTFKYNADLFKPETIDRLIHHFTILVESIVADPVVPVGQLNLLDDDGKKKILKDWNKTAVKYPKHVLLHELVEVQVDKTPQAPALVFEDKQLTYHEFDCAANQMANFLRSRGTAPGSYVGVCMERSVEMVISLHGIAKAGSAYVPLDPAHPDDRLKFMLADSGVDFVLTQEKLADRFPDTFTGVVCVDADWDQITKESCERPGIRVLPSDPAYMIYTSGSTGLPKGVPNSHGGICNRLLWMQDAYRLNATDSVFQKTPFGFDVSVWEFFWPLMAGARLVVAQPGGHKDSRYLVETINRYGITTVHFVPPMLQMFLEDASVGTCKSLRRVICSGEALSYEVMVRFYEQLDAELHNLYGPTEAAIDVTHWACKSNEEACIPIGRPIANTQIYILDRFLCPVPIGVAGELYIGGANVAAGYHNRPELNAEKFIADPFSALSQARLFKTGDLARFLSDGNVEYLGRIDTQVKLRGFRIELGEIEETLRQVPAIADASVILREDRPGDKRLAAYVVTHKQDWISEDELKMHMQSQLPDYMVPANIVFIESLPLSANGKVDRRELPAPRVTISKTTVPPRNTTEKKLVELWHNILGVSDTGVDDDFFELGGHSLLAVRLMAEIEKQLGRRLPLSVIIQNPTPAKLASAIQNISDEEAWDCMVRIREGGTDVPPLFFVPGAGGNVVYLYDLAENMRTKRSFYGIQAVGLDGKTPPFSRIEDMAAYNVNAMLRVQPQGPFYIAGHCFGGLIAFESALQLERAGHAVACLGILDVPAPRASDQLERKQWSTELWILQFAGMVAQGTGTPLDLKSENLSGLHVADQLTALRDGMVSVNILPPDTPVTQVKGMLDVFIANGKARYLPDGDKLKAPVLVLRAKELIPDYDFTVYDDSQGTLGWKRHIGRKPLVLRVPGDHNTMMTSPHAAETAKCLRRYLDTIDDNRMGRTQ